MAQPFTWLSTVLLTIILPRYLGDADLGKFAFAFAFAELAGLIANLGTASFLTKAVARRRDDAIPFTGAALLTRIPLGITAAALAVGGVNLLGYDGATKQLVYIFCVGVVAESMTMVALGTLQGLHQMRIVAACSIANKLGYAAIASAFLITGAGVAAVAAAWTASVLVTFAIALSGLRRQVPLTISLDLGVWRHLFISGLPFFIWQAALLVYGQVDAVLLSVMTHDAVVGWYAVAYRIVAIPVFIPVMVVTVIFPALVAVGASSPAFSQIARRSLHAVSFLSIPMVIGIILLSDKLIAFFGYPASFMNSQVPLMLLAPHIVLVSVDMVIASVLIARDRQRAWALTGVAAAFLNPLANMLAIPLTQSMFNNGAIGAATVTTLTEVFMLVVGLRLLPAGVFNRASLNGVAKSLVAGGLMAVVVWAARDLPVPVLVPVAATVYGFAAFALGAVSAADIRLLWMGLRSRGSRLAAGRASVVDEEPIAV